MPDHLQELLRQRRLIEEHLAWINREIDRATAPVGSNEVSRFSSQPLESKTPTKVNTPSFTATQNPFPAPSIEANTILAEYQRSPENLQGDVKRGCLLYFAGAMAILIFGITLLYLYSRNHSPPPSRRPAAPSIEKHS